MGSSSPRVDMSPMIDLVFLLLIFFMIASTMITYQKDERVRIPIAASAKVPKEVRDRIILNVYNDGTVADEASNPLSLDQVEVMMTQASAKNPKTRLHLRADARVPHKKVKEVVAASAAGGVNTVIFSTHEAR